MGHESRTRVFKVALRFPVLKLTLRLPESSEIQLQVAPSALKFFPGVALGKDDFLPPDFQRQLGALGQIESLPDLFGIAIWPLEETVTFSIHESYHM